MKTRILSGLFVASGLLLISGCGGGGGGVSIDRSPSAAAVWNQEMLDAISASTFGPTVVSRSIGLTQTAVYDAWALYHPVADPVGISPTLRRPTIEATEANKRIAVSFAAFRTLSELFPGRVAQFRAQMVEMGLNPDNTTTDLSTPEGVGNQAAEALMVTRRSDGSNQLGDEGGTGPYTDYTGYTVATGDPSKWQPLLLPSGLTQRFLTPHWGQVEPFAVTNVNSFLMGGGPSYGSAAYINELRDVVRETGNLDDRKKVIAEYWANGPRTVLPPGTWCTFALVVSERDRHTLDEDVQMLFLVGNAVMDAGIVCWHNKRTYNSARPITAIRNLLAGERLPSFIPATRQMGFADGSQWHPFQDPGFPTPPFAEYTSGHSTFSAAGATVLRLFTGSDNFGYSTTFPRGFLSFEANVPSSPLTLAWSTFSEAADEAGQSRIYGGIHIPSANEEGKRCGRDVGQAVWDRAQQYFNGTAR